MRSRVKLPDELKALRMRASTLVLVAGELGERDEDEAFAPDATVEATA